MDTVTSRGVAPKQGRGPLFSYKAQNNLTIILFLLPAFILFVMFIIYPIVQSVYYSFFSWKGFGPATDFIGLDNYGQILKDKIFHKAIVNGILIIILSLSVQLPLSLALAIMVGRDLPGRGFFRMIFFMPYVISEVIAAIAFLGLYNPDPTRGLVNALLVLIPGVDPIGWMGSRELVLPCIFVVLTWKYFGLHMANTIRTCMYLSILGSLQQFVLVWVMTKGGPVNASEVMSTYMYRYSFVRFWLGYGSSVAIIRLLISLAFSIGYLRIVRQPEYLGAQ
jgi:raffinose/stachyose/melibiose transport system permease protein